VALVAVFDEHGADLGFEEREVLVAAGADNAGADQQDYQ
jgi:hypothetical protein